MISKGTCRKSHGSLEFVLLCVNIETYDFYHKSSCRQFTFIKEKLMPAEEKTFSKQAIFYFGVQYLHNVLSQKITVI